MKRLILYLFFSIRWLMTTGQEIIQLEYFFDNDPGYGNATQIVISPDSLIEVEMTISIAALADGVHTLYLRVRDTLDNWSFIQKRSFIKDSTILMTDPEIVKAEYFFDIDPGYGNALEFPIEPDNMIDLETDISISGLTDGVHTLYVRTKDTLNHWSFIQKSSFLKDSLALAGLPDIVEVEYFFDTDPGYGNGVELTFTPGATILVLEPAPLNSLEDGIHTLYVRAKDEYNKWSFIQKRSFIKDPNERSDPFPITDMEYFIDSDPGYGNGTSFEVEDSTWVVGDRTKNLNSLTQGVHQLYGRAKNSSGKWGFLQKRSFLFESEYIEVAQFKFDSLPGYENWVPSDSFMPFTDIIAEIDFEGICDLDTGWYHIDARVRRMFSWWSKEKRDSIEIKDNYLQTGTVMDQFGDPIPDVSIDVEGIGMYATDVSGAYEFLAPLCWGDSIQLFKDSVYSSQKSCVFQNPVVDYSPYHVIGEIDSILVGYKCVNQSGTIPTNLAYICEDASIMVTKTGEFIDTGSISGYILHNGMLALGTVYAMNASGVFLNNGSLPQNEKLFISPVVGVPGEPFIDVDHECTDIMLPGKQVVFLNSKDTLWLQLDSSGMTSVFADTLLESECSTCEIENFMLSQSLFSCSDFGEQIEFLTVDDGDGNSASCPVAVVVGDTIIPVISCRTDTLVYTDPDQCDFSAIGDELDPVSTWDNCPFTLVNSFSSTDSLDDIPIPLGLHLIQWTINDGHGNTASCDFSITVEDHENPQISCQTTATRNTNLGLCSYTIAGDELNPLSVTDNCTAFTFWNDSTNTSTLGGLTLELGSHLITWIVDDGYGQMDTCYSTITVEDHENPLIFCPSSTTRNTNDDLCTYQIAGTEFDPIFVSDNCFDFTYMNNHSGTNTADDVILTLGNNVIQWTVNDGHGQNASCTVTVNVVDTQVPTIDCPADGMRSTDPDLCVYTVVGEEFDPVNVADNCTDFYYSNSLNNADTLADVVLSIGEHVINWEVVDIQGNTSSCSVIITVEDNQVPSITCPADVELAISSALCDTFYMYEPLTSDNCPGEMITLLSGVGSGNPFPVGITEEILEVEDIGGNTATCSFEVIVEIIPDLVSDTICYGDSIFLEGEYRYLPGVFTDTLNNIMACDSIVITTLDTTTICIWSTEIVYVDSSATGNNTGEDWEDAYVDMQLALDVGERYLNVKQIWVAEGTYFPIQGTNRFKSFVLVDSLIMLAGFQGIEVDSSSRNPVMFPARLSGDIGVLLDTTDNSYHVVVNPDSSAGTRMDGFIILRGTADGMDSLDQSGAGLINFGTLILSNCRLEQCSSIDPGSSILNTGFMANLTLHNVTAVGSLPVPVFNADQAILRFSGIDGRIED